MTRGGCGPVLFLPSLGLVGYVSLDDDVSVLVDLVVAHIRDLGPVALLCGLSGWFFSTVDHFWIGVVAADG